MSVELLHKLQRYLLFALIVSLPLNSIPKRFSIPGLGSNLSEYFFILGLGLLIYEYFKYRFEIDRKAVVFIYLFIIWQIICLLHGLYFYEFNSMLTLDQIPKLQFVLGKLEVYDFVPDELTAIKYWLFARTIKNILLLNNTVFLICFYIYHLYKNDFDRGFKDIRKAVTCLVLIMGAYSVIELFWLKLNLSFARKFLEIVNPYLYDIKIAHGWWPPLLWNGQLRSITREPSFFGLICIMCLPIVWSYIWENKYKVFGGVLVFYYTFMIAATNARTAIVVSLGELFLLVVSVVLVKKKEYLKNVLTILLVTIMAFSLNLVNFKGLFIENNISNNRSIVTVNSANNYLKSNVASVANTTSRSNNARYANLVANVNTIMEYPIMGVGTGLKDAYIDRNLPEFSYSNYEVRNWSRYLHIEGVLKSGYPALNKYADVAVQNGIAGLFLYLSVVLYLGYKILRNRSAFVRDYRVVLLIIAMLGLLAAKLSNAGFVILNGIVWGMLYCKISELKTKKSLS